MNSVRFFFCFFWTVHKIVFVNGNKFAKLELGNYSVIASLKFELHLQLNYGTKLSDLVLCVSVVRLEVCFSVCTGLVHITMNVGRKKAYFFLFGRKREREKEKENTTQVSLLF